MGLATNNLYANYNALQVTWVRTKGRYTINMNYAYGKSMGIVNPALDQYNLNNDYGVQPATVRRFSMPLTPSSWAIPSRA